MWGEPWTVLQSIEGPYKKTTDHLHSHSWLGVSNEPYLYFVFLVKVVFFSFCFYISSLQLGLVLHRTLLFSPLFLVYFSGKPPPHDKNFPLNGVTIKWYRNSWLIHRGLSSTAAPAFHSLKLWPLIILIIIPRYFWSGSFVGKLDGCCTSVFPCHLQLGNLVKF